MKQGTKIIVDALRCSATPGGGCKRNLCPYFVAERVQEEIPIKPDFYDDDGIGYYQSCDVDRIALDAADALEATMKK